MYIDMGLGIQLSDIKFSDFYCLHAAKSAGYSRYAAVSIRISNYIEFRNILTFVGPFYLVLWRCEPGISPVLYTNCNGWPVLETTTPEGACRGSFSANEMKILKILDLLSFFTKKVVVEIFGVKDTKCKESETAILVEVAILRRL